MRSPEREIECLHSIRMFMAEEAEVRCRSMGRSDSEQHGERVERRTTADRAAAEGGETCTDGR